MPLSMSSLRGGSAAIAVQDETVAVTPTVTAFNFTGAGVTATASGNVVTVAIPGGTGSALAVKDETVSLTTGATSLNFAGAGVTATTVGTDVTVTIPGSTGSALAVQDEGAALTAGATSLNFIGAGVTATTVGNAVSITIPGGGSSTGVAITRTVTASTDTVTVADKGAAIAVDTTTNAVVLTLPTTGQVVGDTYTFIDSKANWAVRPASLANATFYGTAQTVALDSQGDQITATWRGLPIGWTIASGSATIDNTTLNTLFGLKASLVSPTFTGVPAVPTAVAGTSTTQAASTAFVTTAVAAGGGSSSSLVISRTASTATDTVLSSDKGKAIGVDTTANAVVLTLPSTGQVVGDTYSFIDVLANWANRAAVLASATFHGTVQTVTLDTQGDQVTATWRGLPVGWTIANGSATIDNTTLNTLFGLKAPLASPTFTGIPTVPTATAGTNTTQAASTQFVTAAVAAMPMGAVSPAISRTVTSATDTMTVADKGMAIAVDTTTNAVVLTLPTTGQVVGDTYTFIDIKMNWGTRAASLASATFYGSTQTVMLDTSGDQITATWRGLPTGWTIANGSATIDSTTLNNLFTVKAPLTSPTFTGIPTVPTAVVGTNTTQIASTAFVTAAVAAGGGGGSTSLIIKDESVQLTPAAASINFTGAGVTTTTVGNDVSVSIPGSTGTALSVQDEGTALTSGATSINFVGPGVTATTTGNAVVVSIPGSGATALAVKDETVTLTTTPTSMNFTGAGVTATTVGTDVTISIPGGSGGSSNFRQDPRMFSGGYVSTAGSAGWINLTTNSGNVMGTSAAAGYGTTEYGQIFPRVIFSAASALNASCGYYSPLNLVFGLKNTQRIHLAFGVSDTLGVGTRLFAGVGANSMMAAAGEFTDNFLGWRFGIGWGAAHVPGTNNLQLITAGETGVGSYTDLGPTMPIPATGSTAFYILTIEYYNASAVGGRRFDYRVEEIISGVVVTGSWTATMPTAAAAAGYMFGIRRTTGTLTAVPSLDIAQMLCGNYTKVAG